MMTEKRHKHYLSKYNCKISYHDPFIDNAKKFNIKNFNTKSISLTKNNLKSYDYGIIVTDHDH